ncbi:hypothetical protein NQL31_002634 [Lotmaria passim]
MLCSTASLCLVVALVVMFGCVVASASPIATATAAGLFHQRNELVEEASFAVDDTASSTASVASSSSISIADGPAATVEKHGTILSGGVIASVTVALVFACFLLVLVFIEVVTSISDFVEHRRKLAYTKAHGGDDPAEPKFGDFRDTAVNMQT